MHFCFTFHLLDAARNVSPLVSKCRSKVTFIFTVILILGAMKYIFHVTNAAFGRLFVALCHMGSATVSPSSSMRYSLAHNVSPSRMLGASPPQAFYVHTQHTLDRSHSGDTVSHGSGFTGFQSTWKSGKKRVVF